MAIATSWRALDKFSRAITSTGTDTEDDFNALVNMTRKTVRVRPGTELVRSIRDVTMDRLD